MKKFGMSFGNWKIFNALSLLLFLLSACTDDPSGLLQGDSEGENGSDNPIVQCLDDTDCSPPFVCDESIQQCVAPACSATDECQRDQDCPSGRQCVQPACTCQLVTPDGDADDSETDKPISADCTNKPCIMITPTELNFGAVQYGSENQQAVFISNQGGADLVIITMDFTADTDTDFTWAEGASPTDIHGAITIKANQSMSTGINLKLQKAGQARGRIQIVCTDTQNANGKPVIEMYSEYKGNSEIQVTPELYDFGPVNVESTEDIPFQIKIRNLPKEMDSNKVIVAGPITIDPAHQTNFRLQDNVPPQIFIGPNNEYSFNIIYDPQTEGFHDVTVKIPHDADYSGANPIEVRLSGEGVVAQGSIDPSPVDFGQVNISGSKSIEVFIYSTGGANLELCGIEWQSVSSNELLLDRIEQVENAIVASNDAVSFRIIYSPTNTGTDWGVLKICTNDHQEAEKLVQVYGTGIQASVDIDPPLLNFGQTLVGTMEQDTVTVTNNGAGSLRVIDLQVDNPVFNVYFDDLPAPGNPILIGGDGDLKQFRIQYNPDNNDLCDLLEPPVDEGTLTIVTDHPQIPNYVVSLRGTPVAPCCEFTVVETPNSGNTINFGEVVLNTTKTMRLRVISTGVYKCEVSSILRCDNTTTEFSYFPNIVGPVEDKFDIQVSYSPFQSWGQDTGCINLETNDLRPAKKAVTFDLIGNGVDPRILITPDTSLSNPYSFGEVLLNTCTDPLQVKISNVGFGTLKLTGWDFYMPGAPGSWIVGDWNPRQPTPDNPIFLRSQTNPPETLSFNVTFCPQEFTYWQEMRMRFYSNDYLNPTVYTFFKAKGKDCDEGWHTCNSNEPCGYYCHRPTVESQVPYEICDDYDNDCDCSTDEDFPINQVCDGIGECGIGQWECSGRFEVRCSTNPGGSENQARAELCDNKDNNCDGKTDEDFLIGDPCVGLGECGIGEWKCDLTDPEKQTKYCDANDNGSDEICDGRDNDCNGESDDGDFFIWEPDLVGQPSLCEDCIGRPCRGTGGCGGSGWGSFECLNPSAHPEITTPERWVQCSTDLGGTNFHGSYEVCNNLDDNCDGNTDEVQFEGKSDHQNHYKGTACDGVGACGAGTWTCDPESVNRVICSTDLGGPNYGGGTETCDGIDNDCDGSNDEDYGVGYPCEGIGECAQGVWECGNDGRSRRCSTDIGGSAYGGSSELCNTKDDNCNGRTDETFNVGQPCVGCQGVGRVECSGLSASICSTDFGGSDYHGNNEICDGEDNDCNGLTDEPFHRGETCDGKGECGTGVYECDGLTAYRCSTDFGGSQYQGNMESCDTLDNDCDGLTDEDFYSGIPCMGIGECKEGVFECASASTYRCSSMPGGTGYNPTQHVEICDDKDNDCDGSVDETTDFSHDINNCGRCNRVCQAAHAVMICNSGDCDIQTCNTGWYNIDGSEENGCECQKDSYDISALGNSCTNAIPTDPYQLTDNNGQYAVVRGNISPLGDEDWYKFRAIDGGESGPDGSGNYCDKYNVQVILSQNPNGEFAFDIYRDNCNTSTPLCTALTAYRFATDAVFPREQASEPTWGRGQCPCKEAGWDENNENGFNYCEIQSFDFYVRVYRAGQAGQAATCSQYEIEVSNGKYHTNN